MNRDKQIEEMARDLFAKVGKKGKEKQIKEMAGIIDKCYPNAKITNDFLAKMLYNASYRKASDVARESIDDFQRTIRHIFLDMCNGNDYNTLNLLQIDSAIEALFDSKIAELKNKYESEKDNGKM